MGLTIQKLKFYQWMIEMGLKMESTPNNGHFNGENDENHGFLGF